MKIIGVIPARYNSKRFPGKTLVNLHGKPVLQHVYTQALKSSALDGLIIATDSEDIKSTAVGFGAKVVMTRGDCPTGSDRVAEAVKDLDCEIVVNIQADQVMLPPQILDEIIKPFLADSSLQMTTPIYSISDSQALNNPNLVKVVIDKDGFAIYFSRSPIPYVMNKQEGAAFYKHIGIYAYRKPFLARFSQLLPGPLEKLEGLEQLRALENGYRIKTVLTNYDSVSIDTREDLARISHSI